MISAQDLVRYRLAPADLKARFDKDASQLTPVETRLVARWRNRAQAGRDWNLMHYKTYLAVDRAWDSDFYQSTQTLIGMLKDLVESKNEVQALQVVRTWNMTHLICSDADPKSGHPAGKPRLSLPALSSVILSIARSYTLMRISRIVNERVSIPLFKYEPAFSSDVNRIAGEVVTQLIDQIARNLGYTATLSQSVQGACKYGQQLQFIQEEWFALTDYVNGPRVGKEGLRYTLPHPSRTYWDQNHPIWTLNYGTGCRYVGYWRVNTFGELRNNNQLWNRDRVRMSYRMQEAAWQIYFQTTGQCALSHWPANPLGSYVSQLDREANLERPYYTKAQDDQPVWVTEHFETFNPRWDLDDVTMPDTQLWLRVMLASDDTPLYVACLPDRPATAWLYEPDDSRAIQEGLMLQVLPFQDHASNLMSQGILTAKQNLANVTLWDGDLLDKGVVERDLENPNEVFFRKSNFWEFSGKKMRNAGRTVQDLFYSVPLQKQSLAEHLQVLNQLLAMLERVVGMSAQEVGSYASHEQTAEEQRMIHQATSQRYEYVAGWIDQAIEAWKSQIYHYTMAYGHADALAYLSPELVDTAKKAGFETFMEGPDLKGGMLLKAPRDKFRCDNWVAQRDGPNRVPWATIGMQMLQVLPALFQSPVLANDPIQAVKMLNMTFEAMGFPRGFRIIPPPEATPDIQTYVQQQIQANLAQFAEQVKGFVGEEVKAATEDSEKKSSAKPEPEQVPVPIPVPMPAQQGVPPEFLSMLDGSGAGV